MPDDPKVTKDPAKLGTPAEREAATKGMTDQDKADLGSPEAPVSPESTRPVRRIVKGESARTIAGTLAFATLFTVLATELGAVKTGKKNTSAIRILIGGAVATVILLVINEAGDAGAELAEGLAVVTLVTAVLVNGGPVWTWANHYFGSTPTNPTGTTGTTTPTTTPTPATHVTAPTRRTTA